MRSKIASISGSRKIGRKESVLTISKHAFTYWPSKLTSSSVALSVNDNV